MNLYTKAKRALALALLPIRRKLEDIKWRMRGVEIIEPEAVLMDESDAQKQRRRDAMRARGARHRCANAVGIAFPAPAWEAMHPYFWRQAPGALDGVGGRPWRLYKRPGF